jgi:signal transduction histidine kinase/ABC-type phosphate/phosphonate transport system substrate-binding protein
MGAVQEHVRIDLFVRALSQRLGRPVVAEVAPTYEVVDQELAKGEVHLVWATADLCDTFEARARVVLRAVRGGHCYYHSALVCRAEEPLTPELLKGKRAAWVAPRSVGGYQLPMRYLEARGLSPTEVFAEQRFLGTYRNTLLAVLAGEADVAPIYLSHPDVHSARAAMAQYVGADESRLTPFAFTEPTFADGIIFTQRLSEEETASLVSILTEMSGDGGGLGMMLGPFKVDGFARASSVRSAPTPPRPAQHAEYIAVELDAAERCQRVWAPTGRFFGRNVRGGEGKALVEVLGPEASGTLLTLVRAARHSGLAGRGEYRLEVEGQTRWYSAEVTAYLPAPGEPDPDLMALLVRDITELRRLEEPLFQLATFPLLHPEPMLELSLEGELRHANPMTHQRFPDLRVRGTGHPLVEAALAWERRGAVEGELPAMNLEGRHWELTVARQGEPPGLRVFARDVTLRKQMESKLVQSDRLAALGSLAAAVGHEMNNPLAFMMANLSFAREELGLVGEELRTREGALARKLEDVLEALGETTEGAERLRLIVQDLRALSRKPLEYRTRVDVHGVLEDALKLVRGELRHRARLEKDFRPVPPVEADEARLLQIFLNLLLNAVQAMSESEAERNVLRVSTSTGAGGEVVVEVQDTGAWMPPEVLAHVFEPFFATRKSNIGLGLSVSHALVTSLGGSLRAESLEGVGTTFTALLPRAAELPRQALEDFPITGS